MKCKRFLLLALALALLLCPAARAAEGDRNFLRDDDFFHSHSGAPYGGCAAGGALWLYTGEQLYAWHPGDEVPAAFAYELPTGSGEARAIARLFGDGEALWALCTVQGDDGEPGLELAQITVGGDSVALGEPLPLDRSAAGRLCEDYGYGLRLRTVRGSAAAGGKLYLDFHEDSGARGLCAIDPGDGSVEFPAVQNLAGICSYDGARLLIETFDPDARRAEFLFLDPASGTLTPACAPQEAEAALQGIAYGAESGRLFYLDEGYVMAAEGFDLEGAKPVAQLMARYLDQASFCLLPGELYALISELDGVCVRSTAEGSLPDAQIVVQGGGLFRPMVDAYYDFNARHSDAVAVLREDYTQDSAIINDILSRDDSVDVRVAMASGQLYDALRARGYLAPLDGEDITPALEQMYPAIRDALSLDGQIVAVPVYVSGWTLGLDYEGFERIGIPREELPDNWSDFLDLLPTLPERIGGDGRVRIFPDYLTQKQLRSELIDDILSAWELHLRATEQALHYDDPDLAALLDKAMALDLDALGVTQGGDEESYVMVSSGGLMPGERDYILVTDSADCTLQGLGDNLPALLSAVPGEPAPLPLDLAVIFVNPFSKHVDLAREYVAAALDHLDEAARYSLCPGLNEPVEDPDYERMRAEAQRQLDEARAQLDGAEAADKGIWEDEIAELELWQESIELNRWRISREALDWYRAHGDRLMVKGYSFVDVTDLSGEFYDLIEQFLAGHVDAGSFLGEIDRRVQMKLREGA